MSDVVTPVPSDVVGLSPSICLGFGVGTVGVSIMLNTVTAYFPAFMSTVLGQSPVIAGALLMGSKLFDAVADILIGRLSDRTRSRWGRRRPYFLVGAFVSAVAFLLLFAPPPMTDRVLVWYMAAALIIYSAGYSLFNVPYMTMPSEMTQGFHERSRLLSYRTVFVSIGQLIGLAVTAALIERGGGGAAGYRTMGLVMMLIIFASMFATFLGTATAARVEPRDAPQLAGSQLMLLARNRPFMLLAGAKVFQFLAFASSATTGLLFLLNVLHVGYGGQIQFAVSLNLALAGSMPVWVRIGQRIGKRNTYLLGVTLYCAAALSWLVADTSITRFGICLRGVVAGAGSGALILMSISMLADTMAYDRALTGVHREGLLSGIIAVIEKTAFALGVAVVGLLLELAHYVPSYGGALVAQPVSAVRALYLGYALIPMLMFAVNGCFLYFYALDQRQLNHG